MPKLVSMKRDDERSDYCCADMNRYGYGLQINLDDDQCESLGITKTMPVGTRVSVQAIGLVIRSGEELDSDGKGVTVSVQLTDLAITAQGKASDAAKILYGDD